MKLGLQGVTVVYASGDSGVSNAGDCIPFGSGSEGAFSPAFPAACPYVTAVGATQVSPFFPNLSSANHLD
jgi:tripeptidyl-peptidase-1